MNFNKINKVVYHARKAGLLHKGHLCLVIDNFIPRTIPQSKYSDYEHISAAVNWLQVAQDASLDGGVCGRYQLDVGWTSSYPETTGYLIPTFLSLATEFNDQRFRARARRCVDFLLSVQLGDGSFPGGEIALNKTVPAVFNTGQIIHGLCASYSVTGDARSLEAARRASDWLVSIQDDDGAWRRHVYNNLPTDYQSHVSCWLAELGEITGDERYRTSASRNLEWVLSHQDPDTAWFSLSGFSSQDHEYGRSVTHTLAYTIWGVLVTSQILKHEDGVRSALRAAEAALRVVQKYGFLPGVLDSHWNRLSDYMCLTGNAQMALIWLRAYSITKEPRYVEVADKALEWVKSRQSLSNSNPGIRGGVPGSYPVWGDYIYMAFPNWSVKFLIDALLSKKQVMINSRVIDPG